MADAAPWWANDPRVEEIRRRTAEEYGLELEGRGPEVSDEPDPVLSELLSGTCWRELAEARDELASARHQCEASVLNAGTAGYSWGEIGRVLGVSKQQLHRRFNTRQQGRP